MTLNEFMEKIEAYPVIPAVKNDAWLEECCKQDSEMVYVLYGDICNIADIVDRIKKCSKKAIVHIDLITGLESKAISVDFLYKITNLDGIISMKPAMIKRAQELGIFTIQRFYLIDGITYSNVIKHVKIGNPDVIEIMPAGVHKIIKYLKNEVEKPIIASGLSQDTEDIMAVLNSGGVAVSTTNKNLWDC
ncbi:glycerol-3-phosphate responsive antiterminator [Candidatus Epulonipiscium viviparus]|uniref:glycerol-3-phosphate responsive antiterminator n=1 Tax=Candidatus Epulonipiscium viviparus TaxID=420336 RepID=UPI00016C09E5|nr:glycerol-3-phosphate responsive antiterminator [Candidatus Epulopiscium viviparus]